MQKWKVEYTQIQKIVPYVLFDEMFKKLKLETSKDLRKLRFCGEEAHILKNLEKLWDKQQMRRKLIFDNAETIDPSKLADCELIFKQIALKYKSIAQKMNCLQIQPIAVLNKFIQSHLGSQHILKTSNKVSELRDPLFQNNHFPFLALPLYEQKQVPQWQYTTFKVELSTNLLTPSQIKLSLHQPFNQQKQIEYLFKWRPSSALLIVLRNNEYVASAVSSTPEDAAFLQLNPIIFDNLSTYTIYVFVGHQQIRLPCYLKISNLSNPMALKTKVTNNPIIDSLDRIQIVDMLFQNTKAEDSENYSEDFQLQSRVYLKQAFKVNVHQKNCLVSLKLQTNAKLKQTERKLFPIKHYQLAYPLYSIDSTRGVYKYMLFAIHPDTAKFDICGSD